MDWRYKAQLTVAFGLAIIVATYLLRGQIMALGHWGYLGAFVVNAISNATIILPAPGGAIIAIMAEGFNPLLIGVAAGLGGALGGATAYLAGVINGRAARRRRWFPWFQRVMGRFGGLIIFSFALIPILPGDFASLIAGAVRYPFPRYLLFNGMAKIVEMTTVAYLGSEFLTRLEGILTEWARSLF